MLKIYDRLRICIDKFCTWSSALLMAYLAVICVTQVFFRYILNNSISWSEETMRFSFLWLVFLGATTCINDDSSLIIDLFYNKTKGTKIEAPYNLVMQILIIVSSYILLKYGWSYTIGYGARVSGALEIPMFFIFVSMPLCALIMIIHSINKVIHIIIGMKNTPFSMNREGGGSK